MTTGLFPIEFNAPAVNPVAPHGLYAATPFVETTGDDARRWLPSGVQFRRTNYLDGENSSGIWNAPWCIDPTELGEDDVKSGGDMPDDPDPYTAVTFWSYAESEITAHCEAKARERVRRILEFREPIDVERIFADRLLADASTPTTVGTLVDAVAVLEEAFAATSTTGVIHARAGLLTIAESNRLILRDGKVLRTPAGHRWIFGGGYATPLGDTLIATSPTYGRRDQIAVREVEQHSRNRFVTIAERSVVIGYEHSIAAASIEPEA